MVLQRDRRQGPQGEPAIQVRRAEKAAENEAGQHRQCERVAQPRLVQRARAATVGDLHRQSEHEGTDDNAYRHRRHGSAEFRVRRDQWNRRHHCQPDREELREEARRIALADPDPPAGSESERHAGKDRAVTDADQEEQPLAQPDQPCHRNPCGQRERRHRQGGAPGVAAGRVRGGRQWKGGGHGRHYPVLSVARRYSAPTASRICNQNCASRPGTFAIGSPAWDQPTIDSGYSLTSF